MMARARARPTLFWAETVCETCGAVIHGGWVSGTRDLQALKKTSRDAGAIFYCGMTFCSDACRGKALEKVLIDG